VIVSPPIRVLLVFGSRTARIEPSWSDGTVPVTVSTSSSIAVTVPTEAPSTVTL
jgi:hypothetical protein